MSNLADAVIRQQNRQPQDNGVPHGYHTDDLGYWVENNIREDRGRYAEYLLFRIKKLHPNIYIRYGQLYCGHKVLTGSADEMLRLIDMPHASIKAGQAAWIYNRLMETAPEIDEGKIIIGPDIYWDVDKAEICDLSDLPSIIRIKDKNVRKRF